MTGAVIKNPDDSIDFTMTWDDLGTAVLATVTHSVPDGLELTIVAESNDENTSTVRISGGTHPMLTRVKGRAVLDNSRVLNRTFDLRIFAE